MDKTEDYKITNISSDSDESASDSEGEELVIEEIVDERASQFGNGKTEYLIKWRGYHSIHNSWEDSAKVKNEAMQVVLEWEMEKKKLASTPTLTLYRQGKSVDASTESDAASHVQNQLGGSTSDSENEKRRQKSTPAAAETMMNGEEGLDGLGELSNFEGDQEQSSTGTMISGKEAETSGLSNFEVELEDGMGVFKDWLLEQHQHQRHTSNNEAQLQKEIDNLKSMNSALLAEMKNLDLFMLHRRNPEESLGQKIVQLEDRLNMTEFKNALLKQNLKENAAKMETMNSKCNDMSDTLELVSQIFEEILGENVPYEAVQNAIPQVKKKYMEIAMKAAKLETCKQVLMED